MGCVERMRSFEGEIRPVYVMAHDSLTAQEKSAVLEGVSEMVHLTGAGDTLKVFDVGAGGGDLVSQRAVDYVEAGRNASRNGEQLDAIAVLNALESDVWAKGESYFMRYQILAVSEDMYAPGTNFVIGGARKGVGTVISTNRFKRLGNKEMFEAVKTETMHEVGHVFGLPRYDRTEAIEESLGMHCTNKCVMRQGLVVPMDWVGMSNDRSKYGALCDLCGNDLRKNFD